MKEEMGFVTAESQRSQRDAEPGFVKEWRLGEMLYPGHVSSF